MWWPSTLIKLLALILLIAAGGAHGQSLESAVMPGPVIQGHAKLEQDCAQCHVRFDRAAQTGRCQSCHKAIRADIAGGSGYHGRLGEQERECRRCHTDHKGRGAKIVRLEEKQFDHGRTDFLLKGKHRAKSCASCHRPAVKYRATPGDCLSCHRQDDKHKGGLGQKCGNCHGEETWRDGRFDHAKTRFPLRRAHAEREVRCADCHLAQKYVDTPRDCHACHKEDDIKHGHRGQFGTRCDKCHDEGDWKQPLFRHDRDTRYPLLDRHRQAKCDACHRTPLYHEKTPTRCAACHREDDVHKNALGEKCDQCHSPRGWKNTRFDHDLDTRFVLRDKHRQAKCDACHRDKGMREKLSVQCLACHQGDDQKKGHKGRFGDKCERCHNEKSFKPAVFDHARDTAFVLSGKHQHTACGACHKTPLFQGKTDTACYACHKSEDIHFATYGLDCERCHVAEDWRKLLRRPENQNIPGAPFRKP